MRKVIVTASDGNQLYEIDDTGYVNDPARLIWDEKEYGPIPLEFLENYQGLVRDEHGEVTLDQSKLAQVKLSEKAKKDKKEKANVLRGHAMEFLESVNVDTIEMDDLVPIVAALVVLNRRG